MSRRWILCAWLLVGACSPSPSPASRAPAAPSEDSPQAEEAARALLPLLKARHPEDLPSREQILGVSGGREGLLWQAQHGNPLVVRARALSLLRHFPDPEARAVLLGALQQRRAPGELRAGAMRGLSGHLAPLSEEVRAALLAGARDPDLRVRDAALAALASDPALRPDLEALSNDPALSPEARQDALRRLSSP
jgi:hypothetical protein